MAIINNNVQNVQFLRNQTVNITREQAIDLLNAHKSEATDGSALLARYTDNGEVKTLVGYVYVSGDTHDITIIDVQGASGNVDELRDEINAKLGNGISSANTATAQLAALSGSTFVPGTSSSADTSVEGAKAYAYDLIGTIDYSDTAVEGSYVSQVNQVDGKISVSRVELPSSADTAEAKKVVIAVSEDKGQIEVERGTISSSAETMVLTDNADGGVNFEVNIDNDTIIQDATTKKLKVADTALVQYVGDEDTIHISAVDAQNNKTVSSLLEIKEVSTGVPDTVAHRYMLAGTGTTKIGEYIDIPKDSALVNFYLGHVDDLLQGTTAQTEESTSSTVVPGTGDTALVWIMQLSNGKYKLTAVDVHSFIDEAEFASGVTWDSTAKKVKGVVDPTSEKDSQDTPVDFLTVGADGFKISGIKDEIDRKINALDATGGTQTIATDKHVAVEVVEANGLITAVTVTEDNIANADDLAELSGKTVTAITSTNGSITASINDAAGCKEYDLATDASKIKMSGFTSTGVLSGITSSSSITEAFSAVEGIVESNERVISESLNDLNTRINTVSGDVNTISGNVNTISGNVNTISGNVNTISGDVNTLKTNYVSGATVNGTGVTVTDHIIPLTIVSAPATGAQTTPINIATNNNGEITITFTNIDCGYYDGTQG